ncbi:hypothetical protein BCR32DRAFT_250717 [Anaeromyces robustus]|uniref:EF-hand domain-containing protein n=1 Tax=Anaeromyces robustus TaxID=1754192 RepID=A0A1Y1VX22_9FUNG|nr:hypothetical protein BCR32DRAFT_250717 [Anaeromyces robustus]|eukprot:ORX65294.1 hypothetical protein BCR32DRAFT_250717 [Anaeromyces robustus]
MNPPSDPEKVLEYLDKINIKEQIDEYFSDNDKNHCCFVDADGFRNIFNELYQKIGIKEEASGEKEWAWILNLIKKKSGDVLNKEEAIKLYSQMVLIARDYLYCLPPSNTKIK